MFFKKLKNTLVILLTMMLIIPLNVYAYSDYILAGGENIGIELNSSGIIIVGTYNIGNTSPAKEAGLKNGDKILAINDINVNNIKEMLNNMDDNDAEGFKEFVKRNWGIEAHRDSEMIKD